MIFKALYGLKQAPRAWYDTLSQFLIDNHFTRGTIDKTFFYRNYNGSSILVRIYVDDIIFGSTDENLCKKFAKLMQSKYEMSMMGELTYFLGLQVKQVKDGIFISQTKYIYDLFKKFDFTECSSAKTPMATATKLEINTKETKVDISNYRGMVGSLLYITASTPDIMFSTCLCARFQADPRESHLIAIKGIFRYLKGTPNLGIWYPEDSGFDLIGYSDADDAGCRINRKSTTGTCQFLGNKLVSWFSKKQHSESTSTAEAEYIAAGSCCAQVLWMRNQLFNYGFKLEKIPIFCDNSSAIAITQNHVQHSRTKHIDIRYHFIREHVMKCIVELHFVPSEKQLASLPNFNLNPETFQHANISYQQLASSRNKDVEHLLGLVHTEGSILHAKESLKAIPEVESGEKRDYYEGEEGSVDSMSTYEVNEDKWPQVSSFFSLADASVDLEAKYKAAMAAPEPEDPINRIIAQFYKDILKIQQLQNASLQSSVKSLRNELEATMDKQRTEMDARYPPLTSQLILDKLKKESLLESTLKNLIQRMSKVEVNL